MDGRLRMDENHSKQSNLIPRSLDTNALTGPLASHPDAEVSIEYALGFMYLQCKNLSPPPIECSTCSMPDIFKVLQLPW